MQEIFRHASIFCIIVISHHLNTPNVEMTRHCFWRKKEKTIQHSKTNQSHGTCKYINWKQKIFSARFM